MSECEIVPLSGVKKKIIMEMASGGLYLLREGH